MSIDAINRITRKFSYASFLQTDALEDGRYYQTTASPHSRFGTSAHNLSTTPLYQEGPSVALVEESQTTPQRLANFFSRPFRTNPLKRTKSVSKLDRRAQPSDR
ncbi:unnamed protein product, partial [Mesorhabditis spiculigera]